MARKCETTTAGARGAPGHSLLGAGSSRRCILGDPSDSVPGIADERRNPTLPPGAYRQPCSTALFSSLCGERRGELFRHRHILQLHIIGQAVLEGWIGLTDDKRGQVAAPRLRDTKAISADKVV